MERPDITRPQIVDRFYYDYGFNTFQFDEVTGNVTPAPDPSHRSTGFCGLEWRPLSDGRLLVIAYEHPDNPGRSVTNAAEDIAEQFAEQTGAELSRLVWAESYAAYRPGEPVEFDRCTFSPIAGDKLKPAWKRMTAADWQALGIERPAVPALARKQASP